MIQLKKISKIFISGKAKTNALTDISINIKPGEFIALVGPSGSGKTTLLNIIGGLITPNKGQVLIDKKKISKKSDKKLSEYRNQKVGFIFQEFHLEPLLSVKDNILLPTFFTHNKKSKERQALNLIKEVELTDKTNSQIKDLSGGQKQRVAIARALINNPEIILADEPTGNLDTKTGKTILSLLKKLHKQHKTTLIIATHDQEIAKAANKIIKMK